MENEGTRQEKRDRKLTRKRRKMLQHGRSLVRVYKNATLKRKTQRRRKR